MPIYEYKCAKCGDVFEVIQGFSEQPLKVHEGCGGDVQRLISAPALQFKGSGWYITDYARRGSGNSKPAGGEGAGDKGSKADGGKSEGSKSESKPAATTSGTTDKK
jgi:putative FmdB family regulatory protein